MQEFIFSSKKIYYRKNKFKANRPTLVFIHGISGSSSAWLRYENFFKDKFNILSFDLRGHGKSWKPKKLKDYSIAKFSEDFFDLVSFLKIKKFILISHSFGVLVSFDFMSKHSEMIDKCILLSPNASPKNIWSAKIIKPFLKLVFLLKFIPFKQEARGQVDYKKFRNTGDWNIRRMWADITNTSLHVYLYGSWQSYIVDYQELLTKIDFPTLIIHGKQDTIFPLKDSIEISKKIKNSQLIIIENSDHILVLNNFSELSRAINKFINRSFY